MDVGGGEWGEGLNWKRAQAHFWGGVSVLYPDHGANYAGVTHLSKTHQTIHLEWYIFSCIR